MNTIISYLSAIVQFLQSEHNESRPTLIMVPSFIPPVEVYPSKRPGPSIYREL
jgi:hypothetical protein